MKININDIVNVKSLTMNHSIEFMIAKVIHKYTNKHGYEYIIILDFNNRQFKITKNDVRGVIR